MRYFSYKGSSIWIKVSVIQWLTLVCVSRDFDFYYFVQQWPASYCDTKQSCCYPTTGKPAEDFGIHGLWPNYNDGFGLITTMALTLLTVILAILSMLLRDLRP